MSTTIERVRLFAAVVLVGIGGVLTTISQAADQAEAGVHQCTGRCARQGSIFCRLGEMACCCVEKPGGDRVEWKCKCLSETDCKRLSDARVCQW
jgi:hypothetical protein